jgi:nucleoside-diphosphate-sugar epimerase
LALKILVTGAGGYIGTALVDMLIARGNEVTGYDRCFFGDEIFGETLRNPLFTLRRKDIRALEADELSGVDAIMDLAGLSNDQTGDIDENLTYSINYRGRLNVAEAAKKAGVGRYILASSCNVYGSVNSTEITEEGKTAPVSTYAKANIWAEEAVLPLSAKGFSVTVLRLPTVYGLSKRMRFDLVLNKMTLNAVREGRIHVNGGSQWRPLLHVKDVARAFLLVAESDIDKVKSEIFNLGDDSQNYRIRSLAEMVKAGVPMPVDLNVRSDGDQGAGYNVSFRKIKNVLVFEGEFTPFDGIKEVCEAITEGRTETGEKSVTFSWYERIIGSGELALEANEAR